MSKPSQPSPAQVRDLLQSIDPSLRLITSRPLAGGVSAQLTAMDAQLPDGQVDRLVLRQYGSANLRTDPHVAVHEYALLSLLHRASVPVLRRESSPGSIASLGRRSRQRCITGTCTRRCATHAG